MPTDHDIEAEAQRMLSETLNGVDERSGAISRVLSADLLALLREAIALRAFKAYVHQRLDEAGVPTHPDGPHSREGCRVGERLDVLLRELAAARAFKRIFDTRPDERAPGINGCPIHGDTWCTCVHEKEPTTEDILKVSRIIAFGVAFEKWWKTFVGSTHDLESSARAAFIAGTRAVIASLPAPPAAATEGRR